MEADNDVLKTFGGKGANTAVGCARLVSEETEDVKIQVQMLGQLGTDNEGTQYMQYLVDNKIDNSLIVQKEGVPTGQAYILTANQDNSILIVGGANQEFGDLS